jgi:hypothetical protein
VPDGTNQICRAQSILQKGRPCCRCRDTPCTCTLLGETVLTPVRLYSRKKGDFWAVSAGAPSSRSVQDQLDLTCAVVLPQKGRPHWAAQVPGHRAGDLPCAVVLPPKRETVLYWAVQVPGHRAADLWCAVTFPQKGRPCCSGLYRCQSTDQQIYIVRLYPRQKGDRAGLCRCRGTEQQICIVRSHSRKKGRPCWAVGAGAPISRSALYGHTPTKKGDRTEL